MSIDNNINLRSANSTSPETQQADTNLKSKEGPEYPNVFPVSLPGGLFYIDSTPGKENINIRHKSGSFISFDANGDITIYPQKDLKVSSDRNIAIQSGSKVKDDDNSDKLIITAIGDAHIQVQNDLHVEVWGNKYEKVSKDCFLTVDGTYRVKAGNIETATTGKHIEECYEKENINTFQTNKIGIPGPSGVGGQVKDVIFGNRVIEMADPRGIFSIISAGTLELISALDMRTIVGLNSSYTVGGFHNESIGGTYTSTIGGATNINIGGVLNITAGGIMKLNAPQIFLN